MMAAGEAAQLHNAQDARAQATREEGGQQKKSNCHKFGKATISDHALVLVIAVAVA